MLLFYKGYDNIETIQLLNAGSPVDLSSVTEMSIKFRGTLYDSTTYTSAFDWSLGSGRVDLKLGSIAVIDTGTDSRAELVVVDASNPNGVVWGTIPVRVLDMDRM